MNRLSTRLTNRLNVVTLGVHDLPRLRHFYERLGWVAHSQGDEWTRFDLGGATLALFPLAMLAAEAGLPPAPTGNGMKGFTLAVCVERREQVDAAMAVVEQAGGSVQAAPVDRPWGGRSGYFADPEHNSWEVAWVPGSTFTAEGTMGWPAMG